MAMKACFRLSTPSTETSAFRSHHHLVFSKKKQPANPTFFPYPHPKSFHSESTKKKKQSHFFICRAKNLVDEGLPFLSLGKAETSPSCYDTKSICEDDGGGSTGSYPRVC